MVDLYGNALYSKLNAAKHGNVIYKIISWRVVITIFTKIEWPRIDIVRSISH